MGTTGGNRIAGILYLSDPRHYDKVDWVFACGFVLVVTGAVVLYWAGSVLTTVSSIVGMFVGICVMWLCLSFEDGSGEPSDSGRGSKANDAFKDGDALGECEMGRGIGREKGPKGRT